MQVQNERLPFKALQALWTASTPGSHLNNLQITIQNVKDEENQVLQTELEKTAVNYIITARYYTTFLIVYSNTTLILNNYIIT